MCPHHSLLPAGGDLGVRAPNRLRPGPGRPDGRGDAAGNQRRRTRERRGLLRPPRLPGTYVTSSSFPFPLDILKATNGEAPSLNLEYKRTEG